MGGEIPSLSSCWTDVVPVGTEQVEGADEVTVGAIGVAILKKS